MTCHPGLRMKIYRSFLQGRWQVNQERQTHLSSAQEKIHLCRPKRSLKFKHILRHAWLAFCHGKTERWTCSFHHLWMISVYTVDGCEILHLLVDGLSQQRPSHDLQCFIATNSYQLVQDLASIHSISNNRDFHLPGCIQIAPGGKAANSGGVLFPPVSTTTTSSFEQDKGCHL